MTHTVVTEPPVAEAAHLLERCDRCGAAGKIRVFLPSGGDLAFCGHHANLYSETIRTSSKRLLIESGFGWQTSSS
jgi:hypothetical protein